LGNEEVAGVPAQSFLVEVNGGVLLNG